MLHGASVGTFIGAPTSVLKFLVVIVVRLVVTCLALIAYLYSRLVVTLSISFRTLVLSSINWEILSLVLI